MARVVASSVAACAMVEIKFALLESAAGYALFKRAEGDELSAKLTEMQQLVLDFTRFHR